jgi:peptidyl-prolyl cis-trans isomerase B (cyclophilin B)
MGDITLELDEENTPVTANNFLKYVENGHYNNTIFHRVIDGFMIQGGGFNESFQQIPTMAPIINEAEKGNKNKKGSVAMARTSDVNSATAQFFINVADNSFLDHRDKSPQGYGYCVFAQVIEGMDVVDNIRKVQTAKRGQHDDVPLQNVTIISVKNIQP